MHAAVNGTRAEVSIHAPHEGRDVAENIVLKANRMFQFTRPTRGATARLEELRAPAVAVSIHAPHEGRDGCEAAAF